MEPIRITTPLTNEVVAELRVGQHVYINGNIYCARDSTHEKWFMHLDQGRITDLAVAGHIVYYAGPSPPKAGKVIGACGPTTSSRMDKYLPRLLEMGLRGTIGKGRRSPEVVKAMIKYKAVYFAAVGGIAALIDKTIIGARVVAFPDLGAEALYQLVVKDFPVIVANDIYGGDIYAEEMKKYALD